MSGWTVGLDVTITSVVDDSGLLTSAGVEGAAEKVMEIQFTVTPQAHGEDLFFDPVLKVYQTGEQIHSGDTRVPAGGVCIRLLAGVLLP